MTRPWQFQVRHLLGLVTVAALMAAIVAPVFRESDRESQWTASRQTAVVIVAAGGIVGFLFIKRRNAERAAGPAVARCERRSSRIMSWGVAAPLCISYLGTVVAQLLETNRPTQFDLLPGSPVLLFFAVNYLVVRLWWRIDPLAIEGHERGLILGGFNFHAWNDFSRYSWTGSPPRQLNLFLKRHMVMNLKSDPSFFDGLDPLLHENIGAPEPAPMPGV